MNGSFEPSWISKIYKITLIVGTRLFLLMNQTTSNLQDLTEDKELCDFQTPRESHNVRLLIAAERDTLLKYKPFSSYPLIIFYGTIFPYLNV